jgi:hypothetical protein
LGSGEGCSRHLIAQSRACGRRRIPTMPVRLLFGRHGERLANNRTVIAGFFTGGALAIRGGAKAARNSAIGCACLLAVIEGVGIGFQRMMAENTRLDVCSPFRPPLLYANMKRCHFHPHHLHQKLERPGSQQLHKPPLLKLTTLLFPSQGPLLFYPHGCYVIFYGYSGQGRLLHRAVGWDVCIE